MAAVAPQHDTVPEQFNGNYAEPGTDGVNSVEDHDYALAQKAENLNLHDRPASRATHRTTHSHAPTANGINHDVEPEILHHETIDHNEAPALNRSGAEQVDLESPVDEPESEQLRREREQDAEERPGFPQRASRSYIKPIPIVTTYERELNEEKPVERRKSVTSTKAPTVKRAASKAASVRSNKGASIIGDREHHHVKNASVDSDHDRAINGVHDHQVRGAAVNGNQDHYPSRPPSVAGSTRRGRLPQLNENDGGIAVGEVASHHRQHQLQSGNQNLNQIQPQRDSRLSLQDNGPMTRDRSTTFEEPQQLNRATSPSSPQRPQSAFGYRPQPNLLAISESDRHEDQNDGRASRAGRLDRSGTVLSRAGTLGRNGTLSRGANGGTIGTRRGAFGRGAGASIGTQPEEVLGRDDIHMRAELSERILDEATLRKLSTMEKKDARRLTKVIKQEGKAEAKSVLGSIKELERLTKLQREAAGAERKSQLRLSKYTSREHKARLRFLKEKERYERVEGELRNAENDYEERRDHAAGLTSQVAEKSFELDDLRSMKAADDRERAVKLLALKNPGHS